jgi:hypothetical protein
MVPSGKESWFRSAFNTVADASAEALRLIEEEGAPHAHVQRVTAAGRREIVLSFEPPQIS